MLQWRPDDDPRPWSASDSLLTALPHASRVILDDAGHAPWVERPAAVRAEIRPALLPVEPAEPGR